MEIKEIYRPELNILHPFTYHVTHKKYLEDIKKCGLLPKCGERSQAIHDYLEAIYFYLFFERTPQWAMILYDKDELKDVKVLRINIQGIGVIHLRNLCLGECYTLEPIETKYVEILDDLTTTKEIITYNNILEQDQKSFIWKPL